MAESRIRDENYYQVQGWMISKLQLKGVALSVYAIIYGFSQDGENEYTGGVQYLCDFCGGVSKPTIHKALRELVEKAYISRREEIVNGVLFVRYKVILPPVKNFNGGSKENSQEVVKNLNGGSKETLPNNKRDNELSNNNIINNIISRLNEKANKTYRANSKATQTLIKARLAEGYTVEDFFAVIDKKCADWLGTEWEQYLRPSTLFGTKFENYLNAPVGKRKGANGVEIRPTDNDDLAGIL